MRNQERIPEVLRLLETYWTKHPGLRLSQIIENIASIEGMRGRTFFVEDEMILTGLKKLEKLNK